MDCPLSTYPQSCPHVSRDTLIYGLKTHYCIGHVHYWGIRQSLCTCESFSRSIFFALFCVPGGHTLCSFSRVVWNVQDTFGVLHVPRTSCGLRLFYDPRPSDFTDQKGRLSLLFLVRIGRIELPFSRWQRGVLPLNYIRFNTSDIPRCNAGDYTARIGEGNFSYSDAHVHLASLETHGFPTAASGLPSSTGNFRFPTPSHGGSTTLAMLVCAPARTRT